MGDLKPDVQRLAVDRVSLGALEMASELPALPRLRQHLTERSGRLRKPAQDGVAGTR